MVGGGGEDDAPPPVTNNSEDVSAGVTTHVGVFVDSLVEGINYQTETLSGVTNAAGEYSYVAGESVTFMIGNISFPTVQAKGTITPLDLAKTADINDITVVNMVRLLVSLDIDADPSNGITIPTDAHTAATGMSLDFSSSTFEVDVANLVANSGSPNTALIDLAAIPANLEHCTNGVSLQCSYPIWGIVAITPWWLDSSADYADFWATKKCRPSVTIALNERVYRN